MNGIHGGPWQVICPTCHTIWSFATEDEAAEFHDKHWEETRDGDGETHDEMEIRGPKEKP